MSYKEKIAKLREAWLKAEEKSDKKIIEIRAKCLELALEKSGQKLYKTAQKIFKG